MAAVMIVLTIIFTRLLSIQNIPVIPFVRISLGPAVVLLASLVLGPFYGMIVGGAADILGIVMFNNTGFAINPLLTAVYALSGLLPFFVYKLFSLIKSKKISFIVLASIFGSLFLTALIYFIFKDSITLYGGKVYEFKTWHEIVILATLFVLTAASLVAIFFINRTFVKKGEDVNVYTIALMALVSEFIVKTIINSIVKSYMFEVDLLYMFISEVLVLFINIPLYTFFVTFLDLLLKKIIKPRA